MAKFPGQLGLIRDTRGAAMIEFSLVIGLLLVLTLGMIDFSFAFFQWNSASKAVQVGARLAAVSDPVSSDLQTLTGLEGGALPGDPMPSFARVCSGAALTCTGGTYDPAAMNYIISRMDRIFPQVTAANVTIRYTYTGLGFAGRPGAAGRSGGPVPTITVELTGLNFSFFFLNGLLGFSPIQIPAMKTTVTGEDLSTVGS
jgi:Flp pilus assembly pilin Flp